MRKPLIIAAIILVAIASSCQKSQNGQQPSNLDTDTVTTFKFYLNDTLNDWSGNNQRINAVVHQYVLTGNYTTIYCQHGWTGIQYTDAIILLFNDSIARVGNYSILTPSAGDITLDYSLPTQRGNSCDGVHDSVNVSVTRVHNNRVDGEFSANMTKYQPVYRIKGQFKNVKIDNP